MLGSSNRFENNNFAASDNNDNVDNSTVLLGQSDAGNVFAKPMNPYTVLEAKLDEMKEDEDLLLF